MSARRVWRGTRPSRYHSERAICLRASDLLDRDRDLLLDELLQVLLEVLDLGALLPDDDSGPRRVDDDVDAAGLPFDLQRRHAGVDEPLLDASPGAQVLLQVRGAVLLGVPPRSPILDAPQPKPVRMYLLSQKPPPFGSSLSRYFSSTTMVI